MQDNWKAKLYQHRFTFIEASLIILAGFILGYSALANWRTYDEATHMSAGMVFWDHGATMFEPNTPPLRSIIALPSYFLGFYVPQTSIFHEPRPELEIQSLRLGRFTLIGFYLFWAWGCARISRRWIGTAPSLAVLALLLFSPTIVAHAYLTTTDALFTMTAILTYLLLVIWMEKLTWPIALCLGVSCGALLTSKYSGALWAACLGVAFVLFLGTKIYSCKKMKVPYDNKVIYRFLSQALLVIVISLIIINLFYGFSGFGRSFSELNLVSEKLGPIAESLPWLRLPLPADYIKGLDITFDIQKRSSYFAGSHALDQVLLYFPGLVLTKPPLIFLALAAISFLMILVKQNIKCAKVLLFALPPVLFFLYVVFSETMQIGVRHILPLWPCAFLMIGWAMTAEMPKWVIKSMYGFVGILCVQSWIIAPHHLAFFNKIAGGPEGAYRFYIDSNQDWGQGWIMINDYAVENDISIQFEPTEGETTGWVVVNSNLLVGISPEDAKRYQWLREDFERTEFVDPYWHLYYIPEDAWDK